MKTLDRYGLHWMEGDIALLVEDQRVQHVLGIPMEFDVTVKKPRQKLTCPHQIPLYDAEPGELPDCELVRAMLPVPKLDSEPILHVEDGNYVRELLRLSSATTSSMLPLWAAAPPVVASMLQVTNVAPLIIFGPNHDHSTKFNQIVEMALYSPRRLVVVGPKSMVLRPEVIRIDPVSHDLSSRPLERIGAWHLKQRMLGNAAYRPRQDEASETPKD